ncbi:uncharacterized protein MKZ38_009671 [Zalerion maritima]|uniref:Embryonic stem cell-specific 5-hydroxymethylcytosine-binding protein n=1 Tax=Zalerion maritima TaxID=339359 RepID=A0AAD5RT09_9PEZI|nr:uncharacterized protein MKZ38_009671 [Zalerion maritima]
MLQDELNMPVDDAPEDEGNGAPRQSYNFAPGYHGIVYRADGNLQAQQHIQHGPEDHEGEEGDNVDESEDASPRQTQTQNQDPDRLAYKLQSMRWGVIPSWTKRKPDYSSMLKTINCRDDSLASPGGLWASMKGKKRCIVLAQGFYEWLQKSPKEKVPHFVKRKDGKLMCMAGLWDCVRFEGEDETPHFTFTVITTSSNRQLKFLHDRMPVILEPGSQELRMWLDPKRNEWSKDLQALLKPFKGEVDVYPVSKEVGKVGNNSPSFMIPVASKENKNNIANFFAKGSDGQPMKEPGKEPKSGSKRDAPGSPEEGSPQKKVMTSAPSPTKPSSSKPATSRGKISATSNASKSPRKLKGAAAGSHKITSFFKK